MMTAFSDYTGQDLLCSTVFYFIDVYVDVVNLRAQADASMPASNNNVNYTIYSNF